MYTSRLLFKNNYQAHAYDIFCEYLKGLFVMYCYREDSKLNIHHIVYFSRCICTTLLLFQEVYKFEKNNFKKYIRKV